MSQENNQKISLLEKWNNQMKLIQDKTGIKGIYVVIGFIISLILVYLNIFDTIITNLLGTLYPAFWTIKSIENNDLIEQQNWLTYWAVFSFFILLDMLSPIIIKFIPFYFIMKIMFLIWLFMPGTHGCQIIYKLIVKKIFRKYEERVDNVIHSVEEAINEKINNNDNINNDNINNSKLLKKKSKLSKLNSKINTEISMDDAIKAAKEMEDKKEENQKKDEDKDKQEKNNQHDNEKEHNE